MKRILFLTLILSFTQQSLSAANQCVDLFSERHSDDELHGAAVKLAEIAYDLETKPELFSDPVMKARTTDQMNESLAELNTFGKQFIMTYLKNLGRFRGGYKNQIMQDENARKKDQAERLALQRETLQIQDEFEILIKNQKWSEAQEVATSPFYNLNHLIDGKLPLSYLLEVRKKQEFKSADLNELIRYLLDRPDFDVHKVDSRGETVLTAASLFDPEIVLELLPKANLSKAKIDAIVEESYLSTMSWSQVDPEKFRALMSQQTLSAEFSQKAFSMIFNGEYFRRWNYVLYFLKNFPVDPNTRTMNQQTVLMYLLAYLPHAKKYIEKEHYQAAIDILLEHPQTDFNLKDVHSLSTLIYAIKSENFEAAKKVYSKMTFTEEEKRTAMDQAYQYASTNPKSEMAKYFLNLKRQTRRNDPLLQRIGEWLRDTL